MTFLDDGWPSRSEPMRGVLTALYVLQTAALLSFAGPTAAEVRFDTGFGSNYRMKVTSWAEIPFRSVVRQQYDFSCGSAAVATLLSYHYDRNRPEKPIFGAMWAAGDQTAIRRAGFSMLDIKRYLDGIGLKTEGYRLSLAKLRQLERPGIVLLDLNGYKHFVVVKGVAGDSILVGDPMLGLTRYSTAEFASHWNGIFLVIVSDTSDAHPRFNLASDWGPWAAAPINGGRLDAPIGRLTDHLPPLYQITPQLLSSLRSTSVR